MENGFKKITPKDVFIVTLALIQTKHSFLPAKIKCLGDIGNTGDLQGVL